MQGMISVGLGPHLHTQYPLWDPGTPWAQTPGTPLPRVHWAVPMRSSDPAADLANEVPPDSACQPMPGPSGSPLESVVGNEC